MDPAYSYGFGIEEEEDEEFRLAIEMSLVETNNNNNEDDNNNTNSNENEGDKKDTIKEEKKEEKEEKKEEEKKEDEGDAENNLFVRQFTINCICSRALTGTYESDHILDEIISSPEEEKKEVIRGLLDTSTIAEADEAKKKAIEDKDTKLISALPLFTRLAIQNLNMIASKGDPNLSECANLTTYLLTALKSAVQSCIYLTTRDFCTLSNTKKINTFFNETITVFSDVMNKYTTVLEIDAIRTALLDIMMSLFIENKSVTSACNILGASTAKKLKDLVKNPQTKFLDSALTKENGAIKESVLRLISEDINENDSTSSEMKDVFNGNIDLFVGMNGLETVLDYVINKFVQNQKENNDDDDDDDDDDLFGESKEKRIKAEGEENKENGKNENEKDENMEGIEDGDNYNENAQNDFYNIVFSFMKFFSFVYKEFITKSDSDNERTKAINEKILTVSSAVILGCIHTEKYLPPFPLFLIVFKVFSDLLTYGSSSSNISRAWADSIRTLKALFANKVIAVFNGPTEAVWAEHPLSKNTQSALTYAIESLSSAAADYRRLSAAGNSQGVALAREKIELACSSAAKGEFKHLDEVLEQDYSAVLGALAWGNDGESIVDALITASSKLSSDMAFINDDSDSKPATVPSSKSSDSEVSKTVSEGCLLGSLFDSDSIQSSISGELASRCTDREDNLCNACVKIYGMCKKLITAFPALKTPAPLVTFAQNISPNDNRITAKSAAFARNIKNKKNYHQLIASFREFTRALFAADSKNGGNTGEAVVRNVFESFPLFGPLECVLMATRFWSLKRLRDSAQSQGTSPVVVVVVVEMAQKFVTELTNMVRTGNNNEYIEVVNFERAVEVLFLFNCCMDRKSRAEMAVFTLKKLAEAAENAGNIKCPVALTALARLTSFATYFAIFTAKAAPSFSCFATENILERRIEGSPAEEAYPANVAIDEDVIFERTPGDLELQAYYLYTEKNDLNEGIEAPVKECLVENELSFMKLLDCEYEGCDARLKEYFGKLVISFIPLVLAMKPGDAWIDTLTSSETEIKHKDAILLLLIANSKDLNSPALVQKFVEKAFDALAGSDDDGFATFGLLRFLLSALDKASPAAKVDDVTREDKPVSVFDKLAAVEGHTGSTADRLIARMDVPTALFPLPAKAEFDWGSKIDVGVGVAKRLLGKYIAHIAGENAAKLKAFVYSGLSLNDEAAAAIVPDFETYKAKFTSVATLKGTSPADGSRTFTSTILSVMKERDVGIVFSMNLNMAAALVMRILLVTDPKKHGSMNAIARECLALDNFKFADYGVFYDALVSADKAYAGVIASGLWSQFTAAENDEDSSRITTLINNDGVLEKLLALHRLYPNKEGLYKLFVAYNGANVSKIVSALLKDGKKKASGDKSALVEAIRASGLNPEDEAVIQGTVQKLFAAGNNDASLFLCDIAREDSAEDSALTTFANKVYTTILNLVDNKEAIAKISPKTYFTTVQSVSFICGRLIDLFKFAVKKLHAATTSMKVEKNDNNNEEDDGDDDDDLVYPYILIIGSVVRMLGLSDDKVGPSILLDPEEMKVKNALEKMAKNMPYWGCPEKDPNVVCTYTKTEKNHAVQTWYYCVTCKLTNNLGCCAACAAKCHKGHDLRLGSSSMFYCDCGAGCLPDGKKCISCLAPPKDANAMDVEEENEKEVTAASNSAKYCGLYDISKLSTEYVAKLRSEVFSQDTFKVLLEYFNSNNSSLVSKINNEATEGNDDAAAAAATGGSSTAAASAAAQTTQEEENEEVAIAKPTPSSCQRPMASEFSDDLKMGNVSFSLPRYSSSSYENTAPNVSNYASSVALFRKDAMAMIARDSLKILSLSNIVTDSREKTLATIDLPISPIGIVFHPCVPDLMAAFNSDECYLALFAQGSYKIKHQVEVMLPQDDGGDVLNVFWIPVRPVAAGPFLCVVTQHSVLVYNVTKSTSEPAWSYKSGENIAGVVCVKSEIVAGASSSSSSSSSQPSVKATFVMLKNIARNGVLSAFCLSGLGTDAVSSRTTAIDSSYIISEQAALYYAKSLRMVLLTSFRNGEVTGYSITVNDGNDDEFSVERGPRLSVYSAPLLCVTDTVVEGVGVISGVTRDRTTVITVALGSDKSHYSRASVSSFVSGSLFIDSNAEGERRKYLFILQTTSRIGVSTLVASRIQRTSMQQLVMHSAESKPQKEQKKSAAESNSAGAKKAKAKSLVDPITYTYMPRNAPEISENSVYTMIRGTPSSYVIEGDLMSEISSTLARDKLREPDHLGYSRGGVVSQRRGEFKVRVVNKNSAYVITGLQIGLAHSHRSNVPEYISVLGRRIAVPSTPNLCITIAFTFQEVLCMQSYVNIHFGPAKGGLEKIFVDFVTPFFTEKKALGLLPDEWPSKRSVTVAAGAAEARYSLAATTATASIISSLRAMDAVMPAAEAGKSFIDTLMRVFTAVPGKVSEKFRLLDVIEARIKKDPSFVTNVVNSLLPILDASASNTNEDSRSAQLCTIATFLKRVLNSEPAAAFEPIVCSPIIPKLCAAAQAIKSPQVIRKGTFVPSIVSLLFTAQVAVLSRNAPAGADQSKALVDATISLLTSENAALRGECSRAICAHFAEMSDGYKLSSEASAPLPAGKDFAACLREASASYGNDAELLIAAAKRMSLAHKPAPGSVVKSALYFAPNTVDFCAWELQAILAALPSVGGSGGHTAAWDGRLVPALYTVLQLAVRTIRAAALCRPRRYVEELCGTVVQSLLPAATAGEFLNKALMAGLPSMDSCYAVLRVATVAAIVRECARSSSPGTHEAVKWMVKSLPGDFVKVLYEFMDTVFVAEYERLSKVKSSDFNAGKAAGATASANFIPPAFFGIKYANSSSELAAASFKESWKPLLTDAFVDAQNASPAIVSFLYAKRLYVAILYLARKAAAASSASAEKLFDEEQWAELIGRSMVQSKLRFAYPWLLKLARSILSSDAALFSRIDKVGQAKLAAALEALYARTEHFTRTPGAEDQVLLLDLLHGQHAVAHQRPWSWQAHGFGDPTTVPMLYKLAVGYARNRRVKKDIVSISLWLLSMLLTKDDQEKCVLCEEAGKSIYDDGRITSTLGEFMDLFVVCGDPDGFKSYPVRYSALMFVPVLLRTKATARAASTVVLSFLDDVVENHADPSSTEYMKLVSETLSLANSNNDSSDDGNADGDGDDCGELCLLDAFDRHIKKLATYPEASLMIESRDNEVPKCQMCKEDGMSQTVYYDVSTICTRDMIQVLPTSTTFMFSTRHRSFHPPQSRPALPPPLFVEEIVLSIPQAAEDFVKEITIHVAYRPPASSSSAPADEPKWVMLKKVKSPISGTVISLGCGLHIVGIKAEVASQVDEKASPLKCPVCGKGIASLACKKCKGFAEGAMICVKASFITLINSRLENEESAESGAEKLVSDLSTNVLPAFVPN